ncbi:MAG: hypothetical protein NW208_03855 [Bryobacter sp.]|nr:hypothetical protein [Bryobacter sp.]
MSQLAYANFEDYLAAQYAEVRPVTLIEKTYLEQFTFHQFQLLQSRPLAQLALNALLADPDNPELLKRHLAIQRSMRSLERAAKQALTQLQIFTEHRLSQRPVPAKPTGQPHCAQREEEEQEDVVSHFLADLAALDPLEREVLLAPTPATLTQRAQPRAATASTA